LVCNVTRSREEVFDFLADIRNEKLWNRRLIDIEKISIGPIGPGVTFRGRYRGLGRLDTELVEYQRPQRLSFRNHGARCTSLARFY
jgi:hypothetical protein